MRNILQPDLNQPLQQLTLSQQRPNYVASKNNNFFGVSMAGELRERYNVNGNAREDNPITQEGRVVKERYCFSSTDYKGPDSVGGVFNGTLANPVWKSSQRTILKENSKSSLETAKRQLKAVEMPNRNPITDGEFIGKKQFMRRTENSISDNYTRHSNNKVDLPSEKERKVIKSGYVKEALVKNAGSDVKGLLHYKAPNEK